MNLKKIGKVFTSKFVGTGPSSYKKIIYRAAVSQRLRNTGIDRNHLRAIRLLKPEGMRDSRGEGRNARYIAWKERIYGPENFHALRPCPSSKVTLEASCNVVAETHSDEKCAILGI
jgi:hypothetical protein